MSYSNPKTIALLAVLATAVLIALYLGIQTQTPPKQNPTSSNTPNASPDPAATAPGSPAAQNLISQLLATAPSNSLSLNELDQLSLALGQLPPRQAAAQIIAFLDSRADRSTGLTFSVGEQGSIPSPPSLRVFLLDQLGAIAPEQAANYAYTIFETKASADEWALALRNLGRYQPDLPNTRSEVARYADELLKHPPWQQAPSPAYLESFDAIVFGSPGESLEELCHIVNTSSDKALRFAAYLTLERLIEASPANSLAALAQNPSLLDNRPNTRAGLLSKLRQATPENRALVATYLADNRFPETERIEFLQRVPSLNQFHSHTLLSDLPNIRHSSRENLESLAELLASIDPANLPANLQAELARSAERLAANSAAIPQ